MGIQMCHMLLLFKAGQFMSTTARSIFTYYLMHGMKKQFLQTITLFTYFLLIIARPL